MIVAFNADERDAVGKWKITMQIMSVYDDNNNTGITGGCLNNVSMYKSH